MLAYHPGMMLADLAGVLAIAAPWVMAAMLVVLNAIWLLALVLGLPGIWLMIAGALALQWWSSATPSAGGPMFTTWTLVAVVTLAVLSEVFEFLAGMWGTAAAGGTRRGSLGALLGGIAGAVFGTALIPVPIVGSLLGACLGAALGAFGFELSGGRRVNESVASGLGAGVGRFTGTLIKLVLGVAVWVIVAVAAFWP